MRRLLPLPLLPLLAACAAPPERPVSPAQYVGGPIAAVIRDFGNDFRHEPGSGEYCWERAGVALHRAQPQLPLPQVGVADGRPVVIQSPPPPPVTPQRLQCRFRFATAADGRVTGWRAEGDGCLDLLPAAAP